MRCLVRLSLTRIWLTAVEVISPRQRAGTLLEAPGLPNLSVRERRLVHTPHLGEGLRGAGIG